MDQIAWIKKGIATLQADEAAKQTAIENIERWLSEARYNDYVPYIDHLVSNERWGLLLDAFWRMMPFGTGGRRGPVGVGPNRINPFTIGLSVQGHCQYLREVLGLEGDICVVVAHDVRQFFDLRGHYQGVKGVLSEISSLDMARISAMTYAANGIKAIVVGQLQDGPGYSKCLDRYISTPELSFLIRYYGAAGGLNISASHNHPDDNGGKFYNRFGGQEVPPDDEKLLKVVEQVVDVEQMDYDEAVSKGLIEVVAKEAHAAYIKANVDLAVTGDRRAKVGYTPLCGTGMTTVKETLEALGYQVVVVEEQSRFDGSFKSVRYRIGNPEVPDSMDMLEKTCIANGCDIGLSTDPDADRLGIIARRADGSFSFLNGNEIGVLLVQSIISSKKRAGVLSSNGIFVNTLVTSSLQRAIANAYGLQVIGDLMVGFKYIGDVLKGLELNGHYPETGKDGRDSVTGCVDDYVFGCEESHGYLLTPLVRDKDANGAAVHLAGLASELKSDGKTLFDLLRDIYRVYGYHRNVLRSLVMEGIEGLKLIRRIQDVLRNNPPKEVAGMKVRRFVDNHVVGGPLKSSTDEASRNVLLFELDGGDGVVIRLVVRPSGTEPKTKIYVEVPSTERIGGNLDSVTKTQLDQVSDEALDRIIEETNKRADYIGNEFIRYCLGSHVLGDTFGEVPDEALLVSDLVTVNNKLALCQEVLPGLVSVLNERGDGSLWLDNALKSFGEDARGLVRVAAIAWLNNHGEEFGLNETALKTALSLFDGK